MPARAVTAPADPDDVYVGLQAGVAAEARAVADRIRTRMRACVIDTGGELQRMKGLLGHGNFRRWHESALGVDARTVQNYMAVHRAFAGKSEVISHLNSTTLIRLAAKSVPQGVRDAITSRFTDDGAMTDAEVLQAIHAAKASADPAPDPVDEPDDDEADDGPSESETVEEAQAEPSRDDVDDAFAYVFGDDSAPVDAPRTLDLATFAKVRALHDRTDSVGEKGAAAGRMQALAASAGLSVEQAVAMVDAPKVAPGSIFDALFSTPEFRAADAERERKRTERRGAALSEYGSEAAVWEPCERERALAAACRPIITRRPVFNGAIDTLQGWDGAWWHTMPPDAQAAVAGAYAVPETVRDTLAEFEYWEKRIDDQIAFDPNTDHPLCVRGRVAFLENRLDTLPARSLGDLRARMAWMSYWVERECVPDRDAERVRLATLRDDIERFAAKMHALSAKDEVEAPAREPVREPVGDDPIGDRAFHGDDDEPPQGNDDTDEPAEDDDAPAAAPIRASVPRRGAGSVDRYGGFGPRPFSANPSKKRMH